MKNLILMPSVSIKTNLEGEEIFVLNESYLTSGGKMIVNKSEAVLLYIELHKFIFPKDVFEMKISNKQEYLEWIGD